jgi:rod shape-determining protein MreC
MSEYRKIQDMKLKSNSNAPAIAIRPKYFMGVMAFLSLVMLSIGLIVNDRQNNDLAKNIRYSLQIITLPFIELFSSPTEMLQSASNFIGDMTGIYEKNQILTEQNKMLLKWQTVATQLEQENKELRQLLNMQGADDLSNVSARIVSDKHDAISHNIIVKHNHDARIKVGSPVVTAEGLVGYVLSNKGEIAKVLLVSDRQSRIPVSHEQTGERGILFGNNDEDLLMLDHVGDLSVFKIGDRVVTNKSELFNARVAVGEVIEINQGKVYIRPYVDTHNINFVNIITQ